MPSVNDRLLGWDDLEDAFHDGGLLLGNGASQAVSNDFGYSSLYDTATLSELDHPLTEADKGIFSALGTRNFEEVLRALNTAQLVSKPLGLDTKAIQRRYVSIQQALVEAVARVHLEWECVRDAVLQQIRTELLRYDAVYSTNYDLLLYWAMARKAFDGFVDFFWNREGVFDISNTQVYGKVTKVLWLHGGLHLVRYQDGTTMKRRRSMFSLLEKFRTDYRDGAVPLFISEGSSRAKLTAIYQSDYLSFAYASFAEHAGPLVVFGHSLSQQDRHLVEKMRNWGSRNIAIGIRRTQRTRSETVISKKVRFRRLLPQANLVFYDSNTHPLGHPDLRCARPNPHARDRQ